MAKQTINIGTTANDGTGDAIRAAFSKVNDNFTEIYTANTGTNTGDQNLSAYATTAAVAAGYQPLDSDLTAISALTTTAYGRALLSTADAATLRSAIGVGTTDAPTFLAQTLTGQSLTASQATNLLDLSTTWNTTGSPSLIYGRVVNTNSSPTANLIDLGTFAGGSLFKVDKTGTITASTLLASSSDISTGFFGGSVRLNNNAAFLSFGSPSSVFLYRDANGILAQRDGVNAQAFRVYNTYTDASNYDRLSFLHQGGQATIVTEGAGTGVTTSHLVLKAGGTTRSIIFNTNGLDKWSVQAAGHFLAATHNTYDIGATGGVSCPRNVYMGSWIRMAVTTVAGLPAAATAGAGARMFVNDALTPVFGNAVAGSGLSKVPVYSDGTNWNVG